MPLSTNILATSRTVMSGVTDMTLLVMTSDARMAILLNS
jgi:predicted amino acid-binding ACT domain protein